MKIRLLGTGTSQGVPVIGCKCKVCHSSNPKDQRLRTSAMLSWDDHKVVIDCGPDFRTQMLLAEVNKIDGILFTHEHADHTAGLDDIRPLYFRGKKPVPIYALPRVIDNLKKRYDYIFAKENRYPGAPKVAVNNIEPGQTIQIGGKTITALAVQHGMLPILGYKFDKAAYLTDVKYLPEETMTALQNLDVLIINALHHKEHKMHLNLEESLTIIEKLQPKKAILIHISHHMGFYNEIAPALPDNVLLGYDGMEIDL